VAGGEDDGLVGGAAAGAEVEREGCGRSHPGRGCETARLLAAIPGVERFGTSLFSALAPKSQIAPHFGLTNAKLRCRRSAKWRLSTSATECRTASFG
jgi:hypothetical protein